MKKFIVEPRVFESLPEYCVGTVAARGIDNRAARERIAALLDGNTSLFSAQFKEANIRELRNIAAFRSAFTSLGMNPNKFMCSIEALMKRVQKNAALPHINPIVDLGNAFSVRYLLPMGAHDIEKLCGDLEVRYSVEGDSFLPMGEAEAEPMPAGELVYVSGHTVKTRRWIWRQSEDGKIGEETSFAFFPIDGFRDVCLDDVLAARDGLAAFLREEFGCEVRTGLVDREHNEFVIEE